MYIQYIIYTLVWWAKTLKFNYNSFKFKKINQVGMMKSQFEMRYSKFIRNKKFKKYEINEAFNKRFYECF